MKKLVVRVITATLALSTVAIASPARADWVADIWVNSFESFKAQGLRGECLDKLYDTAVIMAKTQNISTPLVKQLRIQQGEIAKLEVEQMMMRGQCQWVDQYGRPTTNPYNNIQPTNQGGSNGYY